MMRSSKKGCICFLDIYDCDISEHDQDVPLILDLSRLAQVAHADKGPVRHLATASCAFFASYAVWHPC